MLEVVVHGAAAAPAGLEAGYFNKLSLISVSLPVEFCLAED